MALEFNGLAMTIIHRAKKDCSKMVFSLPTSITPRAMAMETGAELTKAQYKEMNPAGRAILKCAEYKPALDACNDEYPLQLSTGRGVYHFHTRTKTGRSKELQEKASKANVEMNVEDAEARGIGDGDEVVITSRRGAIQVPMKISKIAKGQVFVPFHYGYWDKGKGSRASAVNELTFGKNIVFPSEIAGTVLIRQNNGISSPDNPCLNQALYPSLKLP